MSSSIVNITKTYSQNGKYYIKCIPYTNEDPSPKGISYVYSNTDKLLYTVKRGFNGLSSNRNYLGLSNDGKTVVYLLGWSANDQVDSLNTVTIYRSGKLVTHYTQQQITGCNPDVNRCVLRYSNFDKVIDKDKSHMFTKEYKKVYKEGISNDEKFLDTSAVFLNNDKLYVTDPDKVVHVIDIKTYKILPAVSFASLYPTLTNTVFKSTQDNDQKYEAPYSPDRESYFPLLANGDSTPVVLARYIGMKAVRLSGNDFNKYKIYRVRIKAYISNNGSIHIESIEVDKGLPLDKITAFFKANKYDVSFFPKEIDKWYFTYFFGGFRNLSDEQAKAEKQEEIKQREIERQKRMTLDSISGVYIPKDLKDCFVQLDKLLKPLDKKEMREQKQRSDMIKYYRPGIGLWIRNNWGLWGGSRLQKYFADRGATDPEGVSMVILENYYDWLNGKVDTSKNWEAQSPVKIK